VDGGEASPGPVRVTITDDTDEFMLAIPGASGDLVRTGRAQRAASIIACPLGPVHLALVEMGFSAVGGAYAHDGSLVLCTLINTPPGARWDGVDLRPGQVFVYPPSSSQLAADPGGLKFGLSSIPWTTFENAATDLGLDPTPATRQHIRPTDAPGPFAATFDVLMWAGRDAASTLRAVDPLASDRMVEAIVRTVSDPNPVRPQRVRRRWENADLVHEALAFLDTIGVWRAPVLTICRHVGVSERRLQLAFHDRFDLGPHEYMRHRALQAAHRALLAADPDSTNVVTIATAHGFHHGGRFARYYLATFGEPPSTTLGRTSDA
jgi:AraC family ethanolamine operon transcriptional activator